MDPETKQNDTALAATAVAEPAVKKLKKQRKLLKSEDWANDVTKGQSAITTIKAALDALEPAFMDLTSAFEALQAHKDDYAERLGNVPENLQQGEHAQRLQAIDEISLDADEDLLAEFTEKLTTLEEQLDECGAADLPRD